MRHRCFALVALAGAMGSMLGCCCDKDGYVIHNDWTLAIRRQPSAAGCEVGCGAAAGTGGDTATGNAASSDAAACEGDGACRSGCRLRGRKAGAETSSAEPGPQLAGPGHFHPVPTRPVFGPAPDLMAVPVSRPRELSPEAMPEAAPVPVPDEQHNSARRSKQRTARAIATHFAMPASAEMDADEE